MTIHNAKIEWTQLGIQDHGIMTFMIGLKWDCLGQGLGGYALDGGHRGTEERTGWGAGIIAIRKILETVGVDSWEKLKGQLLRVKTDDYLGSSRCPIIGHILEDKWFDLKAFAEAQRNVDTPKEFLR